MPRHSLFRYCGAKAKLAEEIIRYYPADSVNLDYIEPCSGSGTVAVRTIREVPFRSFSISDSFSWPVRALQAVRGDLTDWGDIIDRCRAVRERLLPESENEPAIREYFDECRSRCRDGDYWSYIVACQYARGQYCYPQRKDVASFDARYLGHGLRLLRTEQLMEWRCMLRRATVKQDDIFNVLGRLEPNHFAYIDPPYLSNTSSGFRMYGEEFPSLEFHERLRDILYCAKFRFAMSLGNTKLVRNWYLGRFHAEKMRYKSRTQRSKYPHQWEWLFCNYKPPPKVENGQTWKRHSGQCEAGRAK